MLEIKGLTCGYKDGFHIRDINLNVKQGELTGVIGPNGCGKTTLFRAMTKTIMPEEGEIILDGGNVFSMSYNDIAKKIAVVSQDADIMTKGMLAEDYILLGRIPHRKRFQFMETKIDYENINNAMRLTNTTEFSKRALDELSGGERQRVFVSRALAQEPNLLLLDEPTSHLDIGHQIELLELLKDLNRNKGLTIIAILHDLNLSGSYCDRLVLMNEGRIFRQGSVDEVLTYKNIEDVYKTLVIVQKSPITGKPYVFPVPKMSRT